MLFRTRWYASRATALALLAAVAAGCNDDPPGLLPEQGGATPGGPSFALSGACVILSNTREVGTGGFEQFNDFGRILVDADNPACAKNAAGTLRDKLAATRAAAPNTWSTLWLGGNYVALIFAAADRIGAYGHMTPELDYQLQWVANTFAFVEEPGGCGLTVTDNCMDTYSGAASGFAWIAEYQYRRGDPGVSASKAAARTYIRLTFEAACIRRVASTSGYCDGIYPELTSGAARTLSLNEGQQWPAYGFGLMTSIAAAVLGWEGATDSTYVFSDTARIIAKGLFEEARRVIDIAPTPDQFLRACVKPTASTTGPGWKLEDFSADCAGLDPNPPLLPSTAKYTPQMYALFDFYKARLSYTAPTGGYQSTTLDKDTFQLAPHERGDWFGFGRYATYAELGHYWWKTKRPYMPRDRFEARGYVDRVDGARVAHGWACDPDTGTAAVRVELNVNGIVVPGVANIASDATINSQCGGSAHRFAIQLPAGTVGATVTGKAYDWTYGSSVLPCSVVGGCKVPPAPTISVLWVQPAEETWGPAGTQTAAGNAAGGTGGVRLEWRDVTFATSITATSPAWNTVSYEAPVDANNNWSNSIPSPYTCHTFQTRATYFGVTSAISSHNGQLSGHCNETVKVIWIQPSSVAGWGTPGALIVAG
ncbi:MAG TPA: hypothetical protein VEX86_08585, partial [Longimicrobium sp.]|nr:hypothetical protein [Longimicrobium sp.]